MTNARGPLIHLGKLVKSPQSRGEIAFRGKERERARSTYMNIAYFRSALPDRISLSAEAGGVISGYAFRRRIHGWGQMHVARSLVRPHSCNVCSSCAIHHARGRREGQCVEGSTASGDTHIGQIFRLLPMPLTQPISTIITFCVTPLPPLCGRHIRVSPCPFLPLRASERR